MSDRGWWGVDLDGTLAMYDRWVDHKHIGAPVPLMVARVKAWIANGRTVKVFTARVASSMSPQQVLETKEAIAAWTLEHIGVALEATAEKDFGMVELWDDRAITVEENTGISLHPRRK